MGTSMNERRAGQKDIGSREVDDVLNSKTQGAQREYFTIRG